MILRVFFAAASLTVAFATTAQAQECPVAPDRDAEIDALLAEVQAAPDRSAARRVSNRLWEVWIDAPDQRAQTMLDDGMARRASFDFAGAVAGFDLLVAYCPDYAEGWNQRAFVNFLREDFEAALPDLDRAIALEPRHVAAIAGRGMTLIQLGRIREGQDAIREALALNPWLDEARFLTLRPETTDL